MNTLAASRIIMVSGKIASSAICARKPKRQGDVLLADAPQVRQSPSHTLMAAATVGRPMLNCWRLTSVLRGAPGQPRNHPYDG